ncbi:fibrinogen-like protein 1 [Pecten maximus]|uniref:fibrinogen-like protein 1 n=1 Tax=Pecten maximus TaxID=6579 RepID=UPI001459157B|nr:fibrinogen-like protein 1 [Pecten maximus]XP_033754643.1 fibrinogen-like protein 1 [Pecten maximus]
MQNIWILVLTLTAVFEICEFKKAKLGRKIIRTQRCKYTFVVKEVAAGHCPTSIQPPIQSDDQQLMSGDMSTLISRLQEVEKQLDGEMMKNNNLTESISKQELTLKKADYMLEQYRSNFSNLFHIIHHLERSLHTQRSSYRDLEKKVSSVVLDVLEMNNILTTKVSPSDNSNPILKDVQVQSVSKIHNCGLSNVDNTFLDCLDVLNRGHTTSGVYYVTPTYSSCSIPVWCDMDTPPGGWLLLQKRKNGAVDFDRFWNEYKDGFGNVVSEFWIGLDNMFLLTNQDHYELRVDLWDFDDNRVHALYKNFKIDGERDKYKLHASHYEGSAQDSLEMHKGMKFSTPDQDNDNWNNYHCAREWSSGWWYNNCWSALLNGQYHNRSDVKFRGITWNNWKHEQLARTEMKIRPSRLYHNNTVPHKR